MIAGSHLRMDSTPSKFQSGRIPRECMTKTECRGQVWTESAPTGVLSSTSSDKDSLRRASAMSRSLLNRWW